MPQEVRTRRQGRPVTYSANNRVSERLSRGMVYREMYLRLTGQVTLTAGNNTQANLLPGDEWAVVRQVEVIANNTDVIKSIRGEELWWLNHFLYGNRPHVTTVLGDVATANPSFDSVLVLPLWMPRAVKPIDTALDSRELSDLKVEITWGSHTNINASATGFTTNPQVDISSLESFNVEGPFSQWRNFRLTRTITASTTQLQIQLPVGDMYRSFLINTKDGGNDSQAILNNFKLLSGTTVYADQPEEILRQVTNQRLSLEDAVAMRSSNSVRNAWYYYDHVTDGFNAEAIDTLGFSEFTLELDVTVGGGTTELVVIPQQIIPVRGQSR